MPEHDRAMPSMKSYLGSAFWLLVEKVLRLTSGLLVGIWLARYLGPTDFGSLSYALNLVALLAGFLTLGLDNLIVRELVKAPDREDRLLGTALGMRIAGLALSAVAACVILAHSNATTETRFLVGLIWLSTLFQLLNLIELHFQAHATTRNTAIANSAATILSALLKAALIWNEAPLALFAAASILETSILAIFLASFYQKAGRRILRWRFDWAIASLLARQGWPLFLSALAIAVYSRIDQIIIEALLSAEAVGHYAAATRLSESWFFIPTIICNALLPSAIAARSASAETYRHIQFRIYRSMFVLGGAVALPVTLLSDEITLLLYGPAYTSAGTVLSIHIWSGLFVGLGCASSLWLIAEGLTRYSLYRTFIGGVASVTLNFLLIPKLGLTGAAISALCSYFIATFSLLLFSRTRACGIAMLFPRMPK
ncbi:flippase [Azospira restricta]|uniref:Flippase n=1 Tax=Azospira restricta TaxID=404405 RepID=A0A974PY36_9RHOO|nr:flippase [Azospira restricta]QRJ63597.1 flippase [Azospira restricta]